MTTTRRSVCTIIASNYVAYARTLAHTLKATNPDVGLDVLLIDDPAGHFDPAGEPFDVVTVEELTNLRFPEFVSFKYDVLEFSTALKPYFMAHLLDQRPDLVELIYLDPDVLVCRPLDDVFELLSRHPIVLTPHLLSPLPDDRKPNEREILAAGTYNLGFIAVNRSSTAAAMLAWWQERLYDYAAADVAAGLFTDQRWVDLVPAMFTGVGVLRDPAYNVAYWNFHERGTQLSLVGDTVCLTAEPVSFFHYSGYRPDAPDSISKHQDRFSFDDLPNVRPIFDHVASLLTDNGDATAHRWPYGRGHFANGQRIPRLARQHYREQGLAFTARFGDPFETGDGTYWAYLREPVDRHGRPFAGGIARIWWLAWETRTDLVVAFPDPAGTDGAGYAQWVQTFGLADFPDIAALADPDMLGGTPPSPVEAGLASVAVLSVVEPLAPAGWRGAGRAFLVRHPHTFGRVYRWLRRLQKQAVGAPIGDDLRDGPTTQQSVAVLAGNGVRLAHTVAELLSRFSTPAPAGEALAAVVPEAPVHAGHQTHLPGINVVGHFAGEFGIGEVSRGFLQAVESTRLPSVAIDFEGGAHRMEDRRVRRAGGEHRYRVNLFTLNTDTVSAYATVKGFDLLEWRYNIGVWFWELPDVPRRLFPSLSLLNEVWVTSEFCRDALGAVSRVPVVQMPFPFVAPRPTRGVGREHFGLPEDKPLVLVSFDFFSVMARKNPMGAIAAFREAFRPGEATLVMKLINSAGHPRELRALHDALAGVDSHVIDGHLDRGTTSALFAACDAYLSMHRSEGFGLGMAEAMSLGKPVVATGWSGNTAFMTPSNSRLVPYRLVELAADEGPYQAGSQWAEPDTAAAAAMLREVVLDPAAGRALGAAAAADIAVRLNPEKTARAIVDRLTALDLLPAGHESLPD